jgi:hypothetical protein
LAKKKRKKKKKKAARKTAKKAKKARRAQRAARKKRVQEGKAPSPPRHRRAPRVKPIEGPFQLMLPLQMPLALGAAAFAERPFPMGHVSTGRASDDETLLEPREPRPAAGGEQAQLFGAAPLFAEEA